LDIVLIDEFFNHALGGAEVASAPAQQQRC